MSAATRFGLGLLGAALAVGALGDLLLRAVPWGVNVALWTAALILAAGALAYWQARPLGAGRWLLAAALLFAAPLAWRDSAVLAALDLLAALTALGLAPLGTSLARLASAGVADHAWRLAEAGVYAIAGPLPAMLRTIRWSEVQGVARLEAAFPALRGLLLAAPLVVVFGGLFASADAVFQQTVADLFNWDIEEAVLHLLFTGVIAWLAAGVLSYLFLPVGEFSPSGWLRGLVSVGVTEIGIALAALDALFLAFVAIQTRYLFGGAGLVQESATLSYAEYARRGFFELVTVAALTLPLLLAADWALRRGRGRDVVIFRILAGVLVALLFVVMASAVQRMLLYQSQYGLTELRVYTTAFMGWLAALFLLFVVTVLRGRPRPFAFAAFVSGLLAVAALNALNPDALIARVNAARPAFDPHYAAALGAGSVPALLDALPALGQAERTVVAGCLLERWLPPAAPDWRTWNFARSEARRLVQADEERLRGLAAEGGAASPGDRTCDGRRPRARR